MSSGAVPDLRRSGRRIVYHLPFHCEGNHVGTDLRGTEGKSSGTGAQADAAARRAGVPRKREGRCERLWYGAFPGYALLRAMAAPAGGRATTERIPRREQEQTEAEERGVNPIVQLPNGLILQFAHPHSPQSGRPADAGVPAVMPVTARCLPAMDTGSQL